MKLKFITNVSWMVGAELLAKVSRVATVLAMAALLPIVDYGIAMLAVALFELVRVFSRAGAGSKVIQCDEQDVARFSANASLLQWLLCLGLSSIQIAAAELVANFYQIPQLASLLSLLALSYLCFPVVAVKVFQIQRQNRLKFFAIANACVLTVDNLSIVIFLLLGFGVYAVVMAKIIASLLWVAIFLFASVPYIRPSVHRETFVYLLTYSAKVFGSDLSRIGRTQIDVVIAGRLLSPELLGLYSFAKNSGVGLSQSLINAYSGALYPHLCESLRVRDQHRVSREAMMMALLTACIFIAQAAAAPFYVTWLFPERWHDAGVLVAILCLPSCVAIIVDTRGFIYRALNRTRSELLLLLACLLLSTSVLLLVRPNDAFLLAATVLAASATWLIPIAPFLYQLYRSPAPLEVTNEQ